MTAATRHGATAEIAQRIGDVLAERGVETTVVPAEQVGTTEAYDAVVLGSAVWKKHLSVPQKAALTVFRGLEGDFRDWGEIQAWAGRIANQLQKGGGGSGAS